ncbi:hypothetical protein YC2023_090722 [Brassica napus]
MEAKRGRLSNESLEFRKVSSDKARRIKGIFNIVPVKGVPFTHPPITRSRSH